MDTSVISMLAPARAASGRFFEWLERVDSDGRVFLSVVAIHEIEKGIFLLEHKGAAAQAAGLKLWLAGLVHSYDDKIIPFDASAAALAGRLEAKAVAAGHDPGMADAMIAGTAKALGLVIVTKNTNHFAPFGIEVATPDEAVRLARTLPCFGKRGKNPGNPLFFACADSRPWTLCIMCRPSPPFPR